MQAPAFSDMQTAAVEWDGLHIRRACFSSLTDVAVQACTFLLYAYHHHHLGYVTAFISCNSVVVSSMRSLDVDLLLWAKYYRPMKRCCVWGTLTSCLLPAFQNCCQYQLDNLGSGRMQLGPMCGFQAWSTGVLWVAVCWHRGKALWLHLEPTPLENKCSSLAALESEG